MPLRSGVICCCGHRLTSDHSKTKRKYIKILPLLSAFLLSLVDSLAAVSSEWRSQLVYAIPIFNIKGKVGVFFYQDILFDQFLKVAVFIYQYQ